MVFLGENGPVEEFDLTFRKCSPDCLYTTKAEIEFSKSRNDP
jgi:hypothetical protein